MMDDVITLSLSLGFLLIALLFFTRLFQPDPLSSIPGPFLNRHSRLPLKLAIITGERARYIDKLHQRYGHFVRIAPNEIAVSEIQAFKTIHRSGTGYQKANWYSEINLIETDNTEKLGLFQIQDVAEAARRRKLYHRAARRQDLKVWVPAIAQGAEAGAVKVRQEVMSWFCWSTRC
jgi:hypothetical protein